MVSEPIDRLPYFVNRAIRLNLTQQVAASIQAIANRHQSRLTEQFRIASAISAIAKQKQFFNNRPGWGSW